MSQSTRRGHGIGTCQKRASQIPNVPATGVRRGGSCLHAETAPSPRLRGICWCVNWIRHKRRTRWSKTIYAPWYSTTSLELGVIRGFHPLLAAPVERWRPETHTFVLLVGEVTVTLEDVDHIFGLPIDGEPVSGWTNSSSDFVQSQSIAIFEHELVLSQNSKSYIKLGWVRHIRDAVPLDTEEFVRRYVRCQIFCMLGSTLFADKSTAYAHAKYLPLHRDFERIHTYGWGSTCLAHFYRELCRASRYDTKEIDGPLNLLFVWAWERMLCTTPVPRHTLSLAEIPVRPVASAHTDDSSRS
ncbi:hypothetical protein AHAS_Ahas03G0235700 [Arachis hypogaea]